MKAKHIAEIFFLFFCLLVFNLSIYAQTNAQALKFDEFDDSAEDQFYLDFADINISQRTERFINQLKKERGVKAFVIYYQARITGSNIRNGIAGKAETINYRIRHQTRLEDKDIIIINGGYREKNTVEFWIAPKNVAPPKPTPSLEKSETFVCPNISIYNDIPFDEAETIYFSISKYTPEDTNSYSLTWKVSAGEIVEGQETDKIKVSLKNSSVKRVTAFAEINGLPYPCQKVFSATTEIKEKIFQVDSAERYNYSDLSARLDGFMIMLSDNPTARGYIIVYASRDKGIKDMARAIGSVQRVFAFRQYDLSRITIVRGGYREYATVDSWILFGDAEPPKPTPTVSEKFIINNAVKKKIRPKTKP